jgi:hypothetical protein
VTSPTTPSDEPSPRALSPGTIARVIGVLLVVLIVGALGGRMEIGSAGRATPSVGPRPSVSPIAGRPSSSSGPVRVIDVPATVDPTGARDVTGALQALIDRTPDGTTIRLATDAQYRVDGTLRLVGRVGLAIDGRGATLHATTVADYERRTWSLIDSTDITFTDLTVIGGHPDGGTYVPKHEHEHGFGIQGGGAITIQNVHLSDVYGDCVYIGVDDAGAWVDGVRFLDSSCAATGRNGVAVVGGRNVEVARSTFASIALFPFDIEPNESPVLNGAADLSFHDNRITAPVGEYVFAANGWGPVDRVTIADNLLFGVPFLVTVHPLDGSGYRRSDIVLTGNRSDTPSSGTAPVMEFANVDRLTVTGNVQPFTDHGVFAQASNSCAVSISGNVVGTAVQSDVGPALCP